MSDLAGRFLRWFAPVAPSEQSRYQFSIRSLLTFTAKCCCLLSVTLLSQGTALASVALAVFAVWMPFELVLSRTGGPRVPWVVAALFLLSRMLFVYGCCLVALAAVLSGVSLTWASPWSADQIIVVGFGVPIMLGAAAIVSLASGALAVASWRWDRRARWLAYINGGYLAILATVLGGNELFIAFQR